MSVKSILIAANNYPTETDPVYTFLEQLVTAIAKKGIKVTVVAPYRIVQHYLRHTELHPAYREISVEGGECITVYQPRYITFGGRFERVNLLTAKRAIEKVIAKLPEKPDVCYGYFWHWGYCLYDYAKRSDIPLFVHNGETPVILQDLFPIQKLQPFTEYVSGVVCNSQYCERISQEAKLTVADKCAIFPNAINNDIFYPRDRRALREQHGLSEDDFVLAFTGWFNDNKGSRRLSDAIKMLNDKQIKSIFIGDNQGGDYEPTCEGIIHKGRLPHSEIPKWLSMADVFVLPTQHEGSSNGIIEALACGLPVISSDRSFNWDVLNEKNSILIHPMKVEEIASAIKKLKDGKKMRASMAQAALETASELTIDKRATKIVNFIESKLL